MRPRLHRPSPAHRGTGLAQSGSQRSSAETLLGPGHPLTTVLRQFETACEQVVAVTAVQAAGIVFLLGGHIVGLSLALASAAVQLALGWRLALLRVSRRQVCMDLIVEGSRGLGVACVEQECRRLRDPRTAMHLAKSIDEILKAADHPRQAAAARALFDLRVIRSVAPELRQIAALLRDDRPSLRGVAAFERLLTGASTPMGGAEAAPLRQELRRASFLLSVDR